jgi:predicted nicotinamide N-methyase
MALLQPLELVAADSALMSAPRELVSRLDLVEDTVALAGRTLSILRPRSAEALLDDEAFEHEEFLPYWAELWASGPALAAAVTSRDITGRRIVELGCGLALPSFAAVLGGAHVLATDWSPDAIELARENARRNELELETAVVRWSEPEPLLERAPWDLVLAADVLYERRNVDELLALLPRLGAEVLLADPGRPHAKTFLEGAAQTWAIEQNSTISALRLK